MGKLRVEGDKGIQIGWEWPTMECKEGGTKQGVNSVANQRERERERDYTLLTAVSSCRICFPILRPFS